MSTTSKYTPLTARKALLDACIKTKAGSKVVEVPGNVLGECVQLFSDLETALAKSEARVSSLQAELAEQEVQMLELAQELEDAHTQHMVWQNLYADEAAACEQRFLVDRAWAYFFRNGCSTAGLQESLGIEESAKWLENQVQDMARVVIALENGTPVKFKHQGVTPLINPNIPAETLERARKAVAHVMAQQAGKSVGSISPERLIEIREAVERLPELVADGRIRPATGSDWSDYTTDLLAAYDASAPAAGLSPSSQDPAGAGESLLFVGEIKKGEPPMYADEEAFAGVDKCECQHEVGPEDKWIVDLMAQTTCVHCGGLLPAEGAPAAPQGEEIQKGGSRG